MPHRKTRKPQADWRKWLRRKTKVSRLEVYQVFGKLAQMSFTEQTFKMVLSGPITGVPDYRERFNRVAKSMRTLHGPSVTVFNPAELEPGHTERWYMARCAEQLETATHVYFMSGWEYSAGCRAEWAHAVKLGLVLAYQD